VGSTLRSIIRTLAELTRSRGASRGANGVRHRATPGHVQPLSVQLDGTSGHVRHRPAAARKCLLSSRPQVRILLGAQVTILFSLLCPLFGSQPGSQSFRRQPRRTVRRLKQTVICAASMTKGAVGAARTTIVRPRHIALALAVGPPAVCGLAGGAWGIRSRGKSPAGSAPFCHQEAAAGLAEGFGRYQSRHHPATRT